MSERPVAYHAGNVILGLFPLPTPSTGPGEPVPYGRETSEDRSKAKVVVLANHQGQKGAEKES